MAKDKTVKMEAEDKLIPLKKVLNDISSDNGLVSEAALDYYLLHYLDKE